MKYGLLGEKLSHSFSPLIHKQLGNQDYGLFSVPKEQLGAFMERRDFSAINVTIPYKKAVIPFLAVISRRAAAIGSVNTVVKLSDGSLYGDNTDYMGLAFLAAETGISFAGKKVLILGSGGTSLTAQAVAKDGGAARITVVSRQGEVTYEDLCRYRDSQIILNTTPVGMYPKNGERLIRLREFPDCEGVLDVIYNPLMTPLLLEARELGIPYGNGLLMLVAQAKFASDLFFMGEEALLAKAEEAFSLRAYGEQDRQEIRRIYRSLFSDMCNLVLTGMPGSGKTSIGRLLAEALGRPFVDLDEEIVKRYGKSIPEIFAEEGEAGFRDKESLVCREVGKQRGIVIACGGGTVLRQENREALWQNGRVYLIERDLQQLGTEGRPLSKDQETLRRMYEERMPLYRAFAAEAVKNDESPEACAAELFRRFSAFSEETGKL